MARDPPSLLSSSELRDLSPQPSAVRSARVTIIHPQLRDLIHPLERGHVLYPRGTTLEEQRWSTSSDEEVDEEGIHKGGITGSTKPFAKLGFTPNCLTASRGILACGGQHGELYISNLPASFGTIRPFPSRTSGGGSYPALRPFTMSLTLPTRSINNSLIILPSWPDEWLKREVERKLGFIGRGDRTWDEGEHDGTGRVEGGEWVRNSWPGEEEEDEDEEEAMDIEDEEEDDDEVAPLSPASVATYPNTVPFLHAPRIPNLPSSPPPIEIHTTSRASSFSHDRPSPIRNRVSRQSFSTMTIPGQPPIQYVTSLPHAGHSRSSSISSSLRPILRPESRMSGTASSSRTGVRARRKDEPRLLVSNNDQTVKMFSLRSVSPTTTMSMSTGSNSALDPGLSDRSESYGSSSQAAFLELQRTRESERQRERDGRTRTPSRVPLPPPPPPRFGTRFGWDYIAHNDGLTASSDGLRLGGVGVRVSQTDPDQAMRDLQQIEERMTRERDEQGLRREVLAFERVLGMRRSPAPGPSLGEGSNAGSGSRQSQNGIPPTGTVEKEREERKLAKIGGTRFKYAINHSSLSPDLKTMVSVGDSTDVYLFEVIEGGREFRKIGVYSAATDSGFSTSWSKDGRKFAVASQDGQVTVWDHRSSRPLTVFFTASASAQPQSPSFTTDLSSTRRPRVSSTTAQTPTGGPATTTWDVSEEGYPMLIDPVTGDPRLGSSSSGREAARVVKFSPEGSSRDLMVFSEENSNIHVIDARTFNTHIILPVPFESNTSSPIPAANYAHRSGVEGGTWGIAGVAFDPTGDWLYSGSERTVVEWDMRKWGGGEGGTWQMA